MVVSAVATSDDNTLAIGTANGFTGRMTGTSYNSTAGGDHSVGLADKVQATGGTATTMLTWNQTANATDWWAAITFALRPAGPTSLTIDMPTGTVQNDVMVAAIGIGANTPTITAPLGWTLSVGQFNNIATNPNALAVYWKLAGAGETGPYIWTFSTATGAAGGILTFSGVDTVSPINREYGQTTASSLTHATPTIDPSSAGVMLVASFTFNSAATWEPWAA